MRAAQFQLALVSWTKTMAILIPRNRTTFLQRSRRLHADKVLSLRRESLVLALLLDESGGTVAYNAEGTLDRNGAYVNAVPGAQIFLDGSPAPVLDGTGDYINLYSASLNAALSAVSYGEVTINLFQIVSAAADWTDGINHRALEIAADGSNTFRFTKSANNQYQIQYTAGGTADAIAVTHSSIDWTCMGMVVSKSGDTMKAFVNGVQQGATQTGIGTWAGALASTSCVLGAANTSAVVPWKGSFKYLTIHSIAFTNDEMAYMGKLA